MRRPPAVARVLERVTATAREHEMFLPGQTVLVAVSGGPDSVCLLESLVRLRRLLKIRIEVFHMDHRLREGSAADAAYVRRLAERHKLSAHLRAAVSRPAKGESVEAWARERRMVAMGEIAREIGASRIAIGHTMDDQAETVLMALITGSGLRGLGGIAPVLGPWVNPLIDITREEVEACCRSLHLRPRLDPTNRDGRFLRNAIRLKGLPALERSVGRSLREPLVRTAAGLREDAEELTRQTSAVVEDIVEETPEGADLNAVLLLDLPRAIAGRVVAQAVYACGVTCSRADVVAVLDLAAGHPGRRRDLSSGSTARRGREYVQLSRPSPRAGESDGPRPGKGKA
jgi:tRNA(Ile)-lysidine synthase